MTQFFNGQIIYICFLYMSSIYIVSPTLNNFVDIDDSGYFNHLYKQQQAAYVEYEIIHALEENP